MEFPWYYDDGDSETDDSETDVLDVFCLMTNVRIYKGRVTPKSVKTSLMVEIFNLEEQPIKIVEEEIRDKVIFGKPYTASKLIVDIRWDLLPNYAKFVALDSYTGNWHYFGVRPLFTHGKWGCTGGKYPISSQMVKKIDLPENLAPENSLIIKLE